MHPVPLLVLALLPALEGHYIPEESAIIGGKDTDITEAPHMVAVLYLGSLMCGGSIIDEYNILTAAHCLRSVENEVKVLSVRIGSSFYGKGGKVYSVGKITWHEKFGLEGIPDYDVGLIRLAEPIKFGKNAKPISLPGKAPQTGKSVRISGWGITKVESSAHPSKRLQSATVDVVDWEKCRQAYGELTPRMICAARTGIDSCSGDSGGGMDYEGAVVGIVSFGKSCADPRYPGVYTNVADPEILEFIKENLN